MCSNTVYTKNDPEAGRRWRTVCQHPHSGVERETQPAGVVQVALWQRQPGGRAARKAGKHCTQQEGRRRCWEKHQRAQLVVGPLYSSKSTVGALLPYRLLHPSAPIICHPHLTLLHLSLLQQFSGKQGSALESRDLTKTSLFEKNLLEHLACGFHYQFLLQPRHKNPIRLSWGRSQIGQVVEERS